MKSQSLDTFVAGDAHDTDTGTDIDHLSKLGAEFNAAFNTAMYELQSTRQQSAQQQDRIAALDEAIVTLNAELDAERAHAREAIASHAAQVEQHEQQLQQARAENNQHTLHVAELESQLHEQARAVNDLTGRHGRACEERDALRATTEDLQTRLDASEQSLADLRGEYRELEDSQQALAGQVEAAAAELATLRQAHTDLQAHAEKFESLNRALQEASISESSRHQQQLADKDAELARLTATAPAAAHEPLPPAIDDGELMALRTQVTLLEQELAEACATLQLQGDEHARQQRLEDEVTELRKALHEAREQLANHTSDDDAVDLLAGEITTLRAQLEASRAQCRELETELGQAGPTSPAAAGAPATMSRTGRDALMSALETIIDSNGAADGDYTIMYILLDNFILIRDAVGVMNSENVMNDVATIISESCTEDDVLARFGDCTFAVLSRDEELAASERKAQQICETIEGRIFEVGDRSLITTASIGVSPIKGGDLKSEDIIARVNNACEGARIAGGNQVLVNSIIADDVVKLGVCDNHGDVIRRIIDEGKIKLYYQPIASLEGRIGRNFEVLVRVIDEGGNTILPGEFFSMADNADMVVEVDQFIIEQIIKSVAEYQDGPALHFIKLAHESVEDASLPAWIVAKINEYGIDPKQLVFEFAENILRSDLRKICDLTMKLRHVGCGVAVEHYQLAVQPRHLEYIDVDYIKIDSSLVQNINNNSKCLAKVTEIIEIARKFNCVTIAEGVESPASLAILLELGVQFAQGYFIQSPTGNRDFDFQSVMNDA